MNKPRSIKQALKEYYAGRSLSEEQLHNLQKRLGRYESENQKAHADGVHVKQGVVAAKPVRWFISLAASVLLSVMALFYLSTPAVISAAYADIIRDAELNNGIKTTMQQWLDENGVAQVPQQYAVEMSKFCRLDQYLTTHLRIAGREQGHLHLFFHQGKRPVHWLSRDGIEQKMHWRMLNVRDDLTLIVMYTDDMRKSSVEHILAEILPGLQA